MDTQTATDTSQGNRAGRNPVELVWTLTVVHHSHTEFIGSRAALPMGTSLELGRDSACLGDGVFGNPRISRPHVRVVADKDALQLEDRGSKNGTTVNGSRCMAARLGAGDIIGIGPLLLLVHRAPMEYRVPRHPKLIGQSYALAQVLDDIDTVAQQPTSVLLCGESGAGKELVAREIHEASKRQGQFSPLNCGAIAGEVLLSELFGHVKGAFTGADRNRMGLLEASDGGTVFLDEVADASPMAQVSLLRFLDDGEVRPMGSNTTRHVDTRVVAASNRDFESLIAAGQFREDLYARLNSWVIRLPPLRERLEDIPHLAAHFLKNFTRKDPPPPIHRKLMLALLRYSWPRNVRELRNIMERSVIEGRGEVPIPLSPAVAALLESERADGASETETPSDGVKASKALDVQRKPTAEQLRMLLTKYHGNIRQVSENLGVFRSTLYRWFREYGIRVKDYRRHER